MPLTSDQKIRLIQMCTQLATCFNTSKVAFDVKLGRFRKEWDGLIKNLNDQDRLAMKANFVRTGEHLLVNLFDDSTNTYSADKIYTELEQARDAGKKTAPAAAATTSNAASTTRVARARQTGAPPPPDPSIIQQATGSQREQSAEQPTHYLAIPKSAAPLSRAAYYNRETPTEADNKAAAGKPKASASSSSSSSSSQYQSSSLVRKQEGAARPDQKPPLAKDIATSMRNRQGELEQEEKQKDSVANPEDTPDNAPKE